MNQLYKKVIFLAVLIFSFFINHASAQNNAQEDCKKIVLQKDSAFWIAFNTCDLEGYRNFLTSDVEFYHDAGGPTVGLENLIASTKRNLCSGNIKMRRAAVKGSYRIYPLKKGNEIYGAILSGEHLFYKEEQGQKEKPEGIAKFTHLWLLGDNGWKMSRVLSYDHAPAPVNIR